MSKKTIPLRLTDKQLARIEASEKAKADAAEHNEKVIADRQKRRAENASMRVQGARIYEDAAGNMISGRRFTCFTVLLRGKEAEEKAVSWLEDLIRAASGETTQERRVDFIRASCEGAPGQNVTQDMVDASALLKVVEAGLRPWEARLLFDLLKPDHALLTRWHQVVERVTGEVNPQAQGSRVRAACESLLFVKGEVQKLDRQRRAEAA